jgi:hypothetical protein
MKTLGIVRLTVIALLVGLVAAGLGSQPVFASEESSALLSAALHAFDTDPELQREIAQWESQGYVRGPVQSIGLGGICGVAGCDSSFLVAVVLSRRRDIPQHVLANVTVRSPHLTVVRIRRVQLSQAERPGELPEDAD